MPNPKPRKSRIGLTLWIKSAIENGLVNPNLITATDFLPMLPDKFSGGVKKLDRVAVSNGLLRLYREHQFLGKLAPGCYCIDKKIPPVQQKLDLTNAPKDEAKKPVTVMITGHMDSFKVVEGEMHLVFREVTSFNCDES